MHFTVANLQLEIGGLAAHSGANVRSKISELAGYIAVYVQSKISGKKVHTAATKKARKSMD